MANNLDSFYHNHQESTPTKNVLCIVEGRAELSFIKKVYEVYNNPMECQDFVRDNIKLSYGMRSIEWQGNTSELRVKSRETCNFQGGDLYRDENKIKAPLPILESLYNEDLEVYTSIIVMFDKDRDADNFVENKAREILEEHSNKILFLSRPCFEKESMTFFMNEEVREFIEKNYETLNKPKCQWYKQNYSKCIVLNPISNAKKLDTLINKLDKIHLENANINLDMTKLIEFIKIAI